MARTLSKSELTVLWSPKLSVGIPEVDKEHQRYLSLANDLVKAIVDGKGKPEVQRLLGLLVQDAISHFDHEERLFDQYGYPEAKQHAAIHAKMRKWLARVEQEFAASEPGADWTDKALHVRQELLDHMLKEDLKYVGYLS